MRAFTEPLTQLQGYEELEQAVQKTEGVILVSGCIDAVKPHIVYSVHNGSGNRIIVTFHEQKAKELLEEYRFFDKNVAYYPAKDILFYQSDIRGNVLTSERINALKMMAEEKECTIITTFDGSDACPGKVYPGSEENLRGRYRGVKRTDQTSGRAWI